MEVTDMKKKWVKFAGIACACFLFAGNMTVYAVPVREDVQIDSWSYSDEQWEKLIDWIIDFKNQNTTKTDAEIVGLITTDVNARSVETRGIADIWNALTESEKLLVVRYPFAALKVNDAKNIAVSQTEKKFGYSGLGDRSDAFRHGIWNAEMTIMIGTEKAELFATAHEDKDTSGVESDGHTKEEHKNMDLHNNSIGRDIGQEKSDLAEDQMADYIYEQIFIDNSPFIWLND